MPAFDYIALDAAGQKVSGSLTVPTRSEAYRKLEQQRLTPVSVNESATAQNSAKQAADALRKSAPIKLKRTELILFTEELADLIDGGLQLEQALRVMHERQESVQLRQISGRIREQVREGSTFSKAQQVASPSFDEMYYNLTAAGEASGTLPVILRQLSSSISKSHELQSRVLGAMVYPAFLFSALILLLMVFFTVLVPGFTEMLSKGNSQMPPMMSLLVSFSEIVKTWWIVALSALIASILGFRAYIRTPTGHLWWDQAKMRLPLFGPVLRNRFLSEFSSSMGSLVSHGIPLLNALKLVAKATPNIFYRKHLLHSASAIGEGTALSNALRKQSVFPALFVDMIAMGEQTGNLGRALEKSAQRYEKALDKSVKRVTSLITPIVLALAFILVGFVALAIITSIFDTMSSVRSAA